MASPDIRPGQFSSPFPPDLDQIYQEQFKKNRTQYEVIRELDPVAKTLLAEASKDPKKIWQPSDFLPKNPDQLREFQEMSAGVPDHVLAVLTGNMITEEGLPHFFVLLFQYMPSDSKNPENSALMQFSNEWMAQEHRHGVLLHGYAAANGRINMRAFEESTQEYLINGVDPRLDGDPYNAFVYTSFQERATRVAHRNTAVLAKRSGDKTLAEICGKIASEEGDHEDFYKNFLDVIFDEDPDRAMISFNNMMKKRIAMPGERMPFFDQYAAVAHANGIYTAQDYSDITGHLIDFLDIRNRSVSGEGAKAQEELISRHEDTKGRLDSIMTKRLLREHRTEIVIPWVNSPLSIQNPDTFLRDLKSRADLRRQQP